MRNIPLRIVYEDNYIIVIEKKEGLLSVGTSKGKEELTAYSLLCNYVRNTAPRRGRYAPPPRVFIVHRLDRETSGLMVFAKSEEIKRALQENWDKVVTERKYVAVVNRDLSGRGEQGGAEKEQQLGKERQMGKEQQGQQLPSGTIRTWLKENSAFIVYSSPKDNGGQLAITHYRVLGSNPKSGKSLVELELETGRKNQIRVHMQELDAPIFGDKKYFCNSQQHLMENKKARRLYLHAYKLSFIHPVTGKEMKFSTPVPMSFRTLIS